jgi:pentose-5-phosphate-3-epimerase/CBS domain-containing protein
MKISASIFHPARPWQEFAEAAVQAGSNCLHIDFSEQVPSPIPPQQTPEIHRLFGLPLDIHLVQKSFTIKDAEFWNSVNPEYLTLQVESLSDRNDLKNLLHYQGKAGAGLMINTPLSILEDMDRAFSYILLMCGTPGQSGGQFNEQCIYQIIELRKQYPQLSIHVDGGIDARAMNLLRAFHVDLVVSGSYLAKSSNIYANICELRFGHYAYDLMVSHLMVPYGRLPVVTENTLFRDILPTISHWFMGMVMVVNEARILKGIITDGDLRRAFSKLGPAVFEASARTIMNPHPRKVPPDMNILKFAKFVSEAQQGLVVVPVVGIDGQLVGAVDLHSNLFF